MLLLYKTLWWLAHPLFIVLAVFNFPAHWKLRERLLLYKFPSRKSSLWFHCASLGESKGLEGVLKSFQIEDTHILITASTESGRLYLQDALAGYRGYSSFSVHLAPLDHGPVLRKWLRKNGVVFLVLYEQEIWPGAVDICHKNKIPVMLCAGRYTPRSRKLYKPILPLVKTTYGKLAHVQGQNELERGNLGQIYPGTISAGFDFKLAPLLKMADGDYQKLHGDGFAFISLHRAELDLLLPEIIRMSEQVPVFIFPRYMEDVEYFYTKLNLLDCLKWSEVKNVPPQENLILVDSMGQILKQAKYYNMCFVGGSFVNAGAHNVWEPFMEGIKVIVGPWHYNQFHAVNLLKSHHLLEVVEKPEEILSITYEPYPLDHSAKLIGALKQDYLAATAQILEILKPVANKISLTPLVA